jgi:molybdenum cofactor guanylyltransferase
MIGLVLAGGQSQRMGQNKALLCYQEKPQYAVVLELLKPYCTEVWISSPTILDESLVHIMDNTRYENAGPIAGLLSAFSHQKNNFLVLAIDYPFLDANDIAILYKAYDANQCSSVLYNAATKFYEPYLGIYTQSDIAAIEREVTSSANFSLQNWLVANKILPTTLPNDEHLQSVDTIDKFNQIISKK